jgi:ADP-ribose pyrophosphatase YjhB (NUDIX family)
MITDEYQLNMKMTKFPGGGLNFGEGTIECLKRELMEECSQEITDIKHFYTTDFYQKALFLENHQLISIYYLARIKGAIQFKVSEDAFDFTDMKNGSQSFRWLAVDQINPEEFTFPIDKHVALLLKDYLKQNH